MRNILFALCLAAMSLSASAQEKVVYAQYGFDDNAMPAGFATYDQDGQTLHYTAVQYGFDQGDSWKVFREEGVVPTNYFAASHSRHKKVTGQELQAADDWMVLPAVFVRNADAMLSWRSNSICDNLEQTSTYRIRVSEKGNLPADFTDEALATVDADELNTWVSHSVSLAKYVGKQVHIAFENVTLNGEMLAIDDIAVEGGEGTYTISTNLDPYVCGTTQFTPMLTFTNMSAEPIVTLVTHCQNMATGKTVDNNIADMVMPMDMTEETGTMDIELMPALSIAYGDTLRLKTWVTVNGVDSDPLNTTTVFLSFEPEQHVVIEEGTGSWCGWCPKGIVAMRTIHERYGDTVIPICVHVEDVMEVSGYYGDTGLYFPLGYPSGWINRHYDSEPLVEVHEGARKSVYTTLQGGFETWVIEELACKPMAQVDLTANRKGDVITMESTTTFCIPQTNANLRMAYILTEDSWSNINTYQKNYLAGVDYEMGGFENEDSYIVGFKFEDVARAAAGNAFKGIKGSIPASVSVDTPYKHTATITIPDAVGKADRCSVTAMLIDQVSGRIVNAVRVKPTVDGVDAIEAVETETGKTVGNQTFDLQGRRVSGTPRHGIHVRGGKKVVL